MSTIARDERTGLALRLPEGWRSVEQEAFPLVLVDANPGAEGTFTPNIVATVVPLLDSDDLQSFTERSTTAWLEGSNAALVHVGAAPTDEFDGRETFGLYSEGALGIAVHTLLFAENGLGTRIDLSVRVWDAPEGVTLAPYLLNGFIPPHSAPPQQTTPEQLAELLRKEAERA